MVQKLFIFTKQTLLTSLCSRHYSKCSTNINSSNPHNASKSWVVAVCRGKKRRPWSGAQEVNLIHICTWNSSLDPRHHYPHCHLCKTRIGSHHTCTPNSSKAPYRLMVKVSSSAGSDHTHDLLQPAPASFPRLLPSLSSSNPEIPISQTHTLLAHIFA